MNKVLLFSILCFTLLGCNSDNQQDETLLDEDRVEFKTFTVITSNSSSLPVFVRTNKGIKDLSDNQTIIEGKDDTVSVPIDGYKFVYVSHQKALADTALVSAGDTLRITADDESISTSVKYHNKAVDELTRNIAHHNRQADNLHLSEEIDSLRSIFYRIDYKGVPMRSSNDYERQIAYPLSVDRDSFEKYPIAFTALLEKLREQYDSNLVYISSVLPFPITLKSAIADLNQVQYFQELSMLHNLFPVSEVLDKISSPVFLNGRLTDSPYASTILGTILVKTEVLRNDDRSSSKMYMDWKPAYDRAPRYGNDTLAKYARLLCIERMIDFGEQFEEVAEKYQNFKNTYGDKRLNNYLEQKYLFDIERYSRLKNDVKLMDAGRKIFSLDSIISKNEGKLIYVDFWVVLGK